MTRNWAMAACLLGIVGCEPTGLDVPPPVARVDQVYLRVPLTPLRILGEGTVPNAILLEVLFERSPHARGVPVTGTLDILMFEGNVRPEELSQGKPFHVATYSNEGLKNIEGVGRLGVSYRDVVPWGPRPPSAAVISLVARYTPPSGPPVFSEPIPVALRPS